MRQTKIKKTKSKTRKIRKSKTRNRRIRNIRGGAALAGAVRPIETYRMTDELREILDRTRELLIIGDRIDASTLQQNIQVRVKLDKDTIFYVAKKIASILRDRAVGLPGFANYLNTPIINYLKMLYGNLISTYQMDRYGTLRGRRNVATEQRELLENLEEEFNLENGNNSNAGNGDPDDLFHETDDEILAMVDEFNQQP